MGKRGEKGALDHGIGQLERRSQGMRTVDAC